MKVERCPNQFEPVAIVLESQEEVTEFHAALRFYLDGKSPSCSPPRARGLITAILVHLDRVEPN